jgi:hypothetical protein
VGTAALEGALLGQGVPPSAVSDAGRLIEDGALGVLLYGSYARGDADPGSDVDLLVLADRPAGSRSTGAVSVSIYTPAQLATAAGTLFGMHLDRDGIIVSDTGGQLRRLLATMGEPDPDEVFKMIRHLGAVLEDEPDDAHLAGRTRVARYLLRTGTYVAALAEGRPCFSVKELAARAGDPGLVDVLTSRPGDDQAPSAAALADLRTRVRAIVGDPAGNPHGSLRNLVVAEWHEDRSRASLGALALADDSSGFDYTALTKVLL